MTKGMAGGSRKFTISMPADLFAAVERERRAARRSRSQLLADVYRHHLEQRREQERVARTAAAYARHPVTPEEEWLTEASSELLFADPGEFAAAPGPAS